MRQNATIIIISIISILLIFGVVFGFLNGDSLLKKESVGTTEKTTSEKLEIKQKELFIALQEMHQFELDTMNNDLSDPKKLSVSEESEFIIELNNDITNYEKIKNTLSGKLAETKPIFEQYQVEIGDEKNDDQIYNDVLILSNSAENTLENFESEISYLQELIRLREDIAPKDPDKYITEVKDVLNEMRTVEISLFTSSFLDKYFGSYPPKVSKSGFIGISQV